MPKTILIVEDNATNLRLFIQIIHHLGYAILAAKDGEEGVRMAKEFLPDLVLMDIQMPLVSGSEALRKLKADAATKAIPVIALTSYAMRGDRERFLGEGFAGYISKPINFPEFAETIKTALGE